MCCVFSSFICVTFIFGKNLLKITQSHDGRKERWFSPYKEFSIFIHTDYHEDCHEDCYEDCHEDCHEDLTEDSLKFGTVCNIYIVTKYVKVLSIIFQEILNVKDSLNIKISREITRGNIEFIHYQISISYPIGWTWRITFGTFVVFILNSARHATKSFLPIRLRWSFKIGYVFLVTVLNWHIHFTSLRKQFWSRANFCICVSDSGAVVIIYLILQIIFYRNIILYKKKFVHRLSNVYRFSMW